MERALKDRRERQERREPRGVVRVETQTCQLKSADGAGDTHSARELPEDRFVMGIRYPRMA